MPNDIDRPSIIGESCQPPALLIAEAKAQGVVMLAD